jgi:hypothetical protein
MPDPVRSLIRLAAVTACLFAIVSSAAAQTLPLAEAPSTVQFLSRYDFHLSAAGLGEEDPRFGWDTHFGGDFDLVDYVYGRLNFVTDYEAILGSEMRIFDRAEALYTLEVASSFRVGPNEFAAALHHVSRHLGDRPKYFAVAWNEADVRLLRRLTVGATTVDVTAEGGKVVARAYVDYSWTVRGDVTVRHAFNPNVGLFARGMGRVVGVLPESTRERQHGGHLEGGLRLTGPGGAMELFAGVERVIDADLIDGQPRSWAFAGFRIVTK